MSKFTSFILLLLIFILCILTPEEVSAASLSRADGLELCQFNCDSSDRLIGPTRMEFTRPHPWKVAQYPTKTNGFCKLGCQYFYSQYPTIVSCKAGCDNAYRYKVSAGYSDIAEEARLECRDGCDIGVQICQAGYYCAEGNMTVCPPGRFREAVASVSIVSLSRAFECTECPYGRYRPIVKGKSAEECNLCPIGKYANKTGGVQVSDCERCPAGKFAEQEGMQLCKCITRESCNLVINFDGSMKTFFNNTPSDVDFYRESIPYIGRW